MPELTATLCAGNKTVMRELGALVVNFLNAYSLIGRDGVSKTYSLLESYVNYHKPRSVSGKQKERARQMMIAKGV